VARLAIAMVEIAAIWPFDIAPTPAVQGLPIAVAFRPATETVSRRRGLAWRGR
jgi:hypothetical protein